MKIGKFIYTILMTVVIVALLLIFYNVFKNQIKPEGLEKLAGIMIISLLFVFYIILYLLQISTIITSISCLFSSSKVIKIISVILLILNIGLIVISVLFTKYTIKFFKQGVKKLNILSDRQEVIFTQDVIEIQRYICSNCGSVLTIMCSKDFSRNKECPFCKRKIKRFISKTFNEIF